MNNNQEGPLWQLKQQIEHYEKSGRSFREDADRYHKKADDAFAMAEQYKTAVATLESNYSKVEK